VPPAGEISNVSAILIKSANGDLSEKGECSVLIEVASRQVGVRPVAQLELTALEHCFHIDSSQR